MKRKDIYNKMMDYANENWKAGIYESEREQFIEDYECDRNLIDAYIDFLLEDIEYNPARCEDAKELLSLVKTL